MARSLTPSNRVALVPMLGVGWSFPVQREDGAHLANLENAADERSVRQAIEIILSTSKGERAMRPEFGCDLNKLLFAPNNGATQAMAAYEVSEALKAWEPRIEILDVDALAGGEDGQELLIDIHYRVRSTDNRFNLVYPFYLDRALT